MHRYTTLCDDFYINLNLSTEMELVGVPAGEFMMGSPAAEPGRVVWEGPQHPVTLTQGFYMGIHEVTQAQWRVVMGTNPSVYKGDDRPVEIVSWNNCQQFLRRLNTRALPLRLCRAPRGRRRGA